jgi:tetratricopeptide (TPR) repeat protein
MPTLQQALQLHQAGRLAEAEAIYRRILAQHPQHPDALHLLGLIAQQNGDAVTALTRIDAAIAIADSVAEYHYNRGVVLLRLGRAAEAEPSLRRALELKPVYPDAYNALGNALRRRHQPEAAIDDYRRALAQRPDHIDAWCGLAAALQEKGDLRSAEAGYGNALARRPDHAAAWHGLASVQRELAAFDDAIASYRRAVAADSANRRYWLDLADALADFDRVDEARACLHDIVARWPDTAAAQVCLARLASRAGDHQAARAHARAVLARDPDSLDALCAMLDVPDEGVEVTLKERAERLAEDEGRPLLLRSRLHFALAQADDRAGAYDRAFDHYRRGNDLRRLDLEAMGKRFDATVHPAFVDRQTTAFSAEFFAQRTALGTETELPVFIVGMPRSGTTLCEQILASHSQVRALGEQLDIQSMARELPVRLAAGGGFVSRPYPDCMADLRSDVARQLVAEYLGRLRRLAPQAARVTDKHPTNFRHLGLIATLMPGARIIHCRRDPMDTCFSCFAQDFAAPIPWAWDLTAIGQYYRQYDRLMRHWQAVLPVPVFTFAYEEAVQDLEATARRLIAFCGLPWEGRCLDFHTTERPILTASRQQVRRPVYSSSVGRWRRYERHLEPLRATLGDLVAAADS